MYYPHIYSNTIELSQEYYEAVTNFNTMSEEEFYNDHYDFIQIKLKAGYYVDVRIDNNKVKNVDKNKNCYDCSNNYLKLSLYNTDNLVFMDCHYSRPQKAYEIELDEIETLIVVKFAPMSD